MFWTQFSVAFNDNVFKNGLVLLVTYSATMFGEEITILGMGANMLNPVSNLLLIAPFVLFSAIAGQVSDRFSKSSVIRWVKAAEIAVMVLAAGGFILAAVGMPVVATWTLLALVFLMGLQSAFFGPSKYAILPQLLDDQGELVSGNALVEMGTYFSVLGGIAVATGLILIPGGLWWFAVAVVGIAILGYLVSRWIPALPAANPELRVSKEPFTSTWDAARVLLKDRDVLQSVLGISWFWALGGAVLVLFSTYAKTILFGGPETYAVLMGLFAVGIGVGSIACEKLSFGRLEIGLVPVGSVGLFIGLLGLFFIGSPWGPPPDGVEFYSLWQIAQRPMFWVLAADVLVLAGAGGFFMVPLYTLVQSRADPTERSRIIGANNIVNSFFILLLQGGLMAFALLGVSEPVVFGILGLINVAVAIYIYFQVPEFTLRFVAWVLSNVLYRLNVKGLEHIPEEGPVVLVCNHVSFVDFLIIMGACKRPSRFVMDRKMSKIPVVSILFRQAKVIPITSYKEDPKLVEQALDTVSESLKEGWVVVIFPEGGLTWDGELLPFKSGIERILERDPVPVVPMALNGLWGGFFTRKDGPAMSKPFKRGLYNRIWLTLAPPLPPTSTADELREVVHGIWSERPQQP
ncbi:MAG: MFS transporter [Myxococcota bacterium]